MEEKVIEEGYYKIRRKKGSHINKKINSDGSRSAIQFCDGTNVWKNTWNDYRRNTYGKLLRIYYFRGDSQVKTWIFSIAHNECINYLNKNRKLIFAGDFNISIICADNDMEKKILDKEATEIVIHFIQSREEPIRSLLILRLIEE
ncbi:MAG: sigma-70 family RNA polymerase sigma factor [Clostridiales bacterium]|nr:sigma-70 family RNA polymerase sigma factor [Clostridiales bacterium]